MQTSLTSETANNVVASKPDAFNQKPQSDSTSASFGDEAQKFVLDSNINNKLNLKKNNKNNMELQNTKCYYLNIIMIWLNIQNHLMISNMK